MVDDIRTLWPLLGVAAAWVGVAQLARAAEEDTEQVQHCSAVPLITWANATAWMFLAVPHMAKRARGGAGKPHGCMGLSLFRWLLSTEAFEVPRHPAQFLLIALSTNFSYIAALHFLPASLNTAIFSANPVFTLILSAAFLEPRAVRAPGLHGRCADLRSSLCTRQSLSVVLSVLGVLLIAEPWHAVASVTGGSAPQLAGAGLSLLAALGTSSYQVYFKATFGSSMQPEEVGLFLAYMGVLSSALCGAMLVAALAGDVYRLQLDRVPWLLVGSTAVSSSAFNFLIKFVLSRDSPVAASVATQIGIPLNLVLDVVVVRARVDASQAAGALTMLLSFTLFHHRGRGLVLSGVSQEQLLDGGRSCVKAAP